MQDNGVALACTLFYQLFSLINRNYLQDSVQGQIGKSLSISHSVLDLSSLLKLPVKMLTNASCRVVP